MPCSCRDTCWETERLYCCRNSCTLEIKNKKYMRLPSIRKHMKESERRLKESGDTSTLDLQTLHPLTEKAARLMSKVQLYALAYFAHHVFITARVLCSMFRFFCSRIAKRFVSFILQDTVIIQGKYARVRCFVFQKKKIC